MAFRMNSNKSNMEEFDKSQQEITSLQNKIKRLENVIDAENDVASGILHVPGVYEILAEYYNNAVLEAWEREQEEADNEPQ